MPRRPHAPPPYPRGLEPFAEVLRAGGPSNSRGRSAEVLDLLRGDPARLDELFACIADDDAWVRMRAVDTFEKLVREDPSLGAPYTERVLSELTRSDQPSVQWHVAQLVGVLALTADQRTAAASWLRARLATTDVDWIVAANAMATLVGLAHEGELPPEEVAPLLEVQTAHRSASVRRKATRLLEQLRATS